MAEEQLKTEMQEALNKFEVVVMLEENRSSFTYSFKAQTHVVILSMQLGLYEKMIDGQKVLLRMSNRTEVSKNEMTESISTV